MFRNARHTKMKCRSNRGSFQERQKEQDITVLQFLLQSDIHLEELFRLNIARCYYVEDFITSLVLWDIMQIHFLCTLLIQINIVCITLCEHETKVSFLFPITECHFPWNQTFTEERTFNEKSIQGIQKYYINKIISIVHLPL